MMTGELAVDFASRLGIEASDLEFLRYSQNHVFALGGGCGQILRVTDDEHRSRPQIEGELELVRHLHAAGAPVAPLAGDEIVTVTSGGKVFHGVIFKRAPGRPIGREDLSADLCRAHGSALGMFHRHSRTLPFGWAESRPRWDEERYFTRDITDFLPAEHQAPLRVAFERFRGQVASEPRTDRTFGPVHFDLGYSNIFVESGRLTAFDFDNCTASYFLGDIAAALYGSIFTLLRCEFAGDRSAFERPKSSLILREILPSFREGYESAFAWPDERPEHLQYWLDILYFRSVIHAWRLQFPVTNPRAKELLDADIENILTRKTPLSVTE